MNVKPAVKPRDAWKPIEASEWTEDKIRHLLRRSSWTARPADVSRLKRAGLDGAMDYLFKRASYPQPNPVIEAYADNADSALAAEFETAVEWAKGQSRWKEASAKIKNMSFRDPYARSIVIAHHRYQREETRKTTGKITTQFVSRADLKQRKYWADYGHEWLKIASRPQNSAFEKLNLFLQNICVVNFSSIREQSDFMADIHNHHRSLRDHFFGSYPEMIKKMYKTRGMGKMLDIIGSTKANPNENFARELQELFVLGVDRGYSEDDIKEAAKAFTGYVPNPELNPYTLEKEAEELTLNPKLHDDGRKRIFGRARNYDGDAVVDLVFTKEGAETHLARELSHEFLIEGGLPDEYLEPLGKAWRKADFNVYWLFETFFKSRLFYDLAFRGQIYKSPFQFYLGALQDLGLQVEPTSAIVGELDFLGQSFADPPDVNGWNGGAFWMNNGTINGRRIIIDRLFSEDGFRRGMKMKKGGAGNYTVSSESIREYLKSAGDRSDQEIVGHFITYLLSITPNDDYTVPLQEHFARASDDEDRVVRLKQIIQAILQSQYYQVC
ncbi:MAG: DUF1800 domain-containing protein [Verrucomicrobiales bacterium]|nr:DUF1800 domain-containing protein [Verrucomicrobiales bacterium]